MPPHRSHDMRLPCPGAGRSVAARRGSRTIYCHGGAPGAGAISIAPASPRCAMPSHCDRAASSNTRCGSRAAHQLSHAEVSILASASRSRARLTRAMNRPVVVPWPSCAGSMAPVRDHQKLLQAPGHGQRITALTGEGRGIRSLPLDPCFVDQQAVQGAAHNCNIRRQVADQRGVRTGIDECAMAGVA